MVNSQLFSVMNKHSHLSFNITEKGQMKVPDYYNSILEYTRKYGKNNVFQ